MRVFYTKAVLSVHDFEWDYVDYRYSDGEVLQLKGDNTATAAETAQAGFDQTLMGLFQSQYGQQQNLISYLTNQMKPIIAAGGIGMTPAALAASRTSATDTVAANTQNAVKAANVAAAKYGGDAMPSGVGAEIIGNAEVQGAEQQAQAQNEITLANQQLKNTNLWNAYSILNGQQPILSPLGYGEEATSGTNAVANTSQAITAANGPTFGQVLGGIVGGGLGALGQVFTGSFAKGGAFAPQGT